MLVQYLSQQPVDDFSLRFPSLKYSATLAAAGSAAFTVPGDARRYIAVVKCSADPNKVWIAYNKTVIPPVGATFNVTTSELVCPKYARQVTAGDVLNILNSDSVPCSVSIVLYEYIS